MKKILIAGNWKMNTTAQEAKNLVDEIKRDISVLNFKSTESNPEILVCPPFINIPVVSEAIKDSVIHLGAQNCCNKLSGAFTGEVSVPMLKYFNCSYIIIGHSERRQYYFETDELINEKLKLILYEGLKAIVCIGETLEERQTGKTFKVLESQLRLGLKNIDSSIIEKIVIAYEPVWAIGTGISAENEQVQEAHSFIRGILKELFGELAGQMLIQYGGSVNAQNASEILSLPDVNGALIGGASLKSASFVSIIKSAMESIAQSN